MNAKTVKLQYFSLTFFNTFATSLIWGINTLFLLDAGLSNAQAFTVNAAFTAGMMIFEIPTGVVADTVGRRTSFIMGTVTLFLTSAVYYLLWQTKADVWVWIVVTLVTGLGFTFFSGAIEAWLVDALNFTKFKESLEEVFATGQVIHGIAMLSGATLGGCLAQVHTLGIPYLVRAFFLLVSFAFAFFAMKDLGFKSRKITNYRIEKTLDG